MNQQIKRDIIKIKCKVAEHKDKNFESFFIYKQIVIINMYKPQLKRSILQPITSTFQRSLKDSMQRPIQTSFNQNKQLSLVPEAFFQQCRSHFFKRNVNGLTGVINTCQYNYPKMVEDEIEKDSAGHFEFFEEVFCFYKQKNIYLWQYDNKNLAAPRKFLKHSFDEPITSVYYRQIIHADFSNKNIMLVAIAFGQVVKFYRLQNFQLQNSNCIPYLQDLLISLYSPQIVTNISMIHEQSVESQDKNILLIILGDSNGNLILFDFNTKKKFILDSIKEKLKRKIQKQSYSQIIQILPYKQFVFCLVKRHYEPETAWKFFQKIFKSQNANFMVQQRIQVYRIQANATFNNSRSSLFTNSKIMAFKKHCQYTTAQIISKVKNSFAKHFQYSQNDDKSNDFQYIQSISLKDDFVQIMFKSGQSIVVDQDISFAQPPRPCMKKPHQFNLYSKIISPIQGESLEKNVLIKSIGTKLMLFEGFIASVDQNCTYFTPFSTRQSQIYVRSIKKYELQKKNSFISQSNEFLIFGHKSMTLVEKITPKLVLFLYCAGMSEEYPHKKYTPQIKNFQHKIQKVIQYLGQVEVLINILELLMGIKLQDGLNFNLRMDLFQLVAKQLSSDQQVSFRQSIVSFEQNQKTFLKNTVLKFTKDIEEMMWKIVFKVDKTKSRLVRNNQWGLNSIQSICISFQVIFSQIFKTIRDWTARNFCAHRETIYRIISCSKIFKQLIESYLQRQSQKNSKKVRNNQAVLKSLYSPDIMLNIQNTQSLNVKFCQMSKISLEKLILLLKVYDYICEMDLHGTEIPKFSDLLFNFDQIKRIQFANTILRSIGVNNQVLIEDLMMKIPQLQLEQARKYNLWQSLHMKSPTKSEDINRTFDTSYEGQSQQLNQILNKYNYKEIQKHFLNVSLDSNQSRGIFQPKDYYLEKNDYYIEKNNASIFINGVTILLKACLKKILDIRRQQIQLSNVISIYKNAPQDYFGVLQLPNLEKKINQLLKQIDFFTKCCEDLVEKIFQKYNRNMIPKESIQTILDTIKSHLTIEVRRKFQLFLERHKLNHLTQSISRRQLFSNSKTNPQSSISNNFLASQLSFDVTRKYQ